MPEILKCILVIAAIIIIWFSTIVWFICQIAKDIKQEEGVQKWT